MKLVIATAALVAAELIAQPPPPRPVGVANPATRPDLKLNAVLLTNGTALGCGDVMKAFKYGQPSDARFLSHFEDPIGGMDGSFQLLMSTQPLLGTDSRTRKACTKQHEGRWDLHWSVFKLGGLPACPSGCSGSQPIQSADQVVVNFAGARPLWRSAASLIRRVMPLGKLWL